jgi:DNA mismatch endonuclease (patch repair protein)
MTDVFTPEKRSAIMSRIRGSGNKNTELRLIELFRAAGITGWRRKQPIHGRPDFVFPKNRIAVFVDGCFWHGCPRHFTLPSNNRKFWTEKLAANQARDRQVTRTLRAAGWRVVRIWEHALSFRNAERTVNSLLSLLKTQPRPPERESCNSRRCSFSRP